MVIMVIEKRYKSATSGHVARSASWRKRLQVRRTVSSVDFWSNLRVELIHHISSNSIT